MANLQLTDRIVDVLVWCSENPQRWPAELRADCAFIHSRYEALKLDLDAEEAWRCAKVEWTRNVLKRSGLVRVAYHFRDCPQPSHAVRSAILAGDSKKAGLGS
jgi:hypothetical protein